MILCPKTKYQATTDILRDYLTKNGLVKTCVILPVSSPFTITIDIQISYFSGVRSS